MTQTEKNKEIVLNYMQELMGDKNMDAVDKYVADNYIQHDPSMPDGKEGVKNIIGAMLQGAPKTTFEYARVAADGDLVFIHYKIMGMDGKPNAIVEIFRVENGKMVEHWDVIQTIVTSTVNKNCMI